VTSETITGARNAEGFFEALRRHTGVAREMLLPAEILGLLTGSRAAREDLSSTRSRDPSRAQDPMISRTRSSLPCPS
jgi:hypothetical protein